MFSFSRSLPADKNIAPQRKSNHAIKRRETPEQRALSKAIESNGMISQSNSTGMSNSGPQLGRLDVNLDTSLLLEGMDSDLRDKQLFKVYRDMYWHDPICGACADLYAHLPFSGEFTLGGAKADFLNPFSEACEILGLKTLMPKWAIDYQVTGAAAGSILHNFEEKKIFDMMTHKYENLAVHTLPLYSQDPIMFLELDPDVKMTLTKVESKRLPMIKKRLGEAFFNKLLESQVELDPVGTVYIPRKTFSFGEGVSFYKRVLPIWQIEKNLFRGTLIESGRRQRGILHLMLGEEGWDPAPEDFNDIADLFIDADADPIGAVIATRLGVSVSEFRQGGDFWKVTDIWEQTGQMKLRALGISESVMSSDASLSTMEGSMSIFVEKLRAFRDSLTRDTFYERVFPLVSVMNGLKMRRGKIIKGTIERGDTEDILRTMNDGSKLFIPSVHWAKQLRPEQDQTYYDMLNSMSGAGIPIPIRALTAAGGFNVDTLLTNADEELALQEELLKFKKRADDLKGRYTSAGADGMASMSSNKVDYESDELDELSFADMGTVLQGKQAPLLNRDFGVTAEVTSMSKTGKPVRLIDQNMANRRANKNIAKALASISSANNTHLTVASKTHRRRDVLVKSLQI
jgi:hypothetical protein